MNLELPIDHPFVDNVITTRAQHRNGRTFLSLSSFDELFGDVFRIQYEVMGWTIEQPHGKHSTTTCTIHLEDLAVRLPSLLCGD